MLAAIQDENIAGALEVGQVQDAEDQLAHTDDQAAETELETDTPLAQTAVHAFAVAHKDYEIAVAQQQEADANAMESQNVATVAAEPDSDFAGVEPGSHSSMTVPVGILNEPSPSWTSAGNWIGDLIGAAAIHVVPPPAGQPEPNLADIDKSEFPVEELGDLAGAAASRGLVLGVVHVPWFIRVAAAKVAELPVGSSQAAEATLLLHWLQSEGITTSAAAWQAVKALPEKHTRDMYIHWMLQLKL